MIGKGSRAIQQSGGKNKLTYPRKENGEWEWRNKWLYVATDVLPPISSSCDTEKGCYTKPNNCTAKCPCYLTRFQTWKKCKSTYIRWLLHLAWPCMPSTDSGINDMILVHIKHNIWIYMKSGEMTFWIMLDLPPRKILRSGMFSSFYLSMAGLPKSHCNELLI